MKLSGSLRRIAVTLMVIGAFSLSLVSLSRLTYQCAIGTQGCLAAAVSFDLITGPEQTVFLGLENSGSTVAQDFEAGSMMSFITDFVQVTSVYLILIGVGTLIALELRELHYLRRLLKKRKYT